MNRSVKTRFAPSPTGHMTMGNTRTALFNYLFAKSQGGKFLLRIEDTDQQRSDANYVQSLLHDLEWMGLTVDEGPLYQSKRLPIYANYYEELAKRGLTYPCFCTQHQLAISRKIQLSQGKPPKYLGTCRSLTETEIRDKIAQGESPVTRFRIPDNKTVFFTDVIKGRQRFNANDFGDFVIRRQDGTPTFMFCNAIDDALMKVTHALRGDDHLSNSPRQLLILEALELDAPEYGHFSLILGSDGAPLSKRNGSVSVKELRELGYDSQAILNYLARLGHSYENNALMVLNELGKQFELSNVARAPARYDHSQLKYWQKEKNLSLDPEEFYRQILPTISEIVPSEKAKFFAMTIQGNCLVPQDAKLWAIRFFEHLTYSHQAQAIFQATPVEFFALVLSCVEKSTNYTQLLDVLKQAGFHGKSLFKPLRMIFTGHQDGPELSAIFELLSFETKILRVKEAARYAKNLQQSDKTKGTF